MARGLKRREFLSIAATSGFVGIAGCNSFDSDFQTGPQTATSSPTTGPPSTNQDYLSGEAASLFGNPLSNATVRILAKPEDSYIAGKGIQPHEELGRTTTRSDGSFQFTEFPESKFETLRQERDLIMVLFTHPNGWFTGGTMATELVFATESVLSKIRPVWKYIIPPTVVTDRTRTRRGVVSTWKWFKSSDPTRQRVGVEVTATNPRTDLDVYNIHDWLNPDTNTRHNSTLRLGSFSLEIPEQGTEVDYENVTVERTKPVENIIESNTGTESPIKAIEKWHPMRSVNGLELGLPARFMTRDLYNEFTEEDIDRAQEKAKILEFALGASPVIGNVMQLVSAMDIMFDVLNTDDIEDPSQWPGLGNALNRSVDRNKRDLVTNGLNLNVVSAVMKVPYRITDDRNHEVAVRGVWSGTFGSARFGQRFSISPAEINDDQKKQPTYPFRRVESGSWTGEVSLNTDEYLVRIETDGSFSGDNPPPYGQAIRKDPISFLPFEVTFDVEYDRNTIQNNLIFGLTGDTTGHLYDYARKGNFGIYSTEGDVNDTNQFVLRFEEGNRSEPITSEIFIVDNSSPIFQLAYDGSQAQAFVNGERVASLGGIIDGPLYGAISLEDDKDSFKGDSVILRNYSENKI